MIYRRVKNKCLILSGKCLIHNVKLSLVAIALGKLRLQCRNLGFFLRKIGGTVLNGIIEHPEQRIELFFPSCGKTE